MKTFFLAMVFSAAHALAGPQSYPPHANVVDVKKPFFGEICYTGDPFLKIIEEKRGGVTRTLGKDEASAVPYSGHSGKR